MFFMNWTLLFPWNLFKSLEEILHNYFVFNPFLFVYFFITKFSFFCSIGNPLNCLFMLFVVHFEFCLCFHYLILFFTIEFNCFTHHCLQPKQQHHRHTFWINLLSLLKTVCYHKIKKWNCVVTPNARGTYILCLVHWKVIIKIYYKQKNKKKNQVKTQKNVWRSCCLLLVHR